MDHNTQTIGDLIRAFLKRNRLEEKYEQIDLQSNWEKIVGPMIAGHTVEMFLRGQVLTLRLNSAALRHTLTFSKTQLMEQINEALGKEAVKDIRFS